MIIALTGVRSQLDGLPRFWFFFWCFRRVAHGLKGYQRSLYDDGVRGRQCFAFVLAFNQGPLIQDDLLLCEMFLRSDSDVDPPELVQQKRVSTPMKAPPSLSHAQLPSHIRARPSCAAGTPSKPDNFLAGRRLWWIIGLD